MEQENILMMLRTFFRRRGHDGFLAGIIMLSLFFPSPGYSGTGPLGERDGGAPATTPAKIYVVDFDLEAEDIESDPGILQRQRERRRLLGDIAPRPLAKKDPAVRARELVDLMSSSLIKELVSLGLNAHRLNAGEATPTDGLLVRGVFTHVDEGNRLRRAVIGFGAGETELQVIVAVDDLSQGRPRPLYEISGGAEGSKMPGAIITLNPYAAAAKFVLSRKDLDKGVKKTASKIAAEIAGRVGR